MKRQMIVSLLILSLMAFFSPVVNAANKFEGTKRCRMCHKNKSIGNQYGIWSKRNHAKAFLSLTTPEAKSLAVSMGITTAPQETKACLICHTPSQYDSQGNQRPPSSFKAKYKASEGVQCEDCHGAGEKYRKKRTMKKIASEGGAAVSPTAKKTGMIFPDENLCRQCHVPKVTIGAVTYKNPTYEGFKFKQRLKEIAHPVPQR